MSGVAIVTDTSALFPSGGAVQLGIARVRVAIALDGEAYDSDDLDDFYGRLSRGAKATTSQPSPVAFREAYERAAAGGARELLSIHLDARVSGIVASAEAARRDAPIPVLVVDTSTVSFGVGICVRVAADTLASGAAAADAAAAAREFGPKLENVFVASWAPGGRVHELPDWTLLEFADGLTRPTETCGAVGEATELMAARVLTCGERVRAAVGHAAGVVEPWANALAAALADAPQVVGVERYRVGAAVGAHTGPLSFGAFWWPAE